MFAIHFLSALDAHLENLTDWTENADAAKHLVHTIVMDALEAAQDCKHQQMTVDQLRAAVSARFGNGQCTPREYTLLTTVANIHLHPRHEQFAGLPEKDQPRGGRDILS